MKWIKASEREAPINKDLCAKILDSNDEIHYCHLFYRSNNRYERRYPKDIVTITPERVEWLDESSPDSQSLIDRVKQLEKERDELKERCISWAKVYDENKSEIEALKKDNERLKGLIENNPNDNWGHLTNL